MYKDFVKEEGEKYRAKEAKAEGANPENEEGKTEEKIDSSAKNDEGKEDEPKITDVEYKPENNKTDYDQPIPLTSKKRERKNSESELQPKKKFIWRARKILS